MNVHRIPFPVDLEIFLIKTGPTKNSIKRDQANIFPLSNFKDGTNVLRCMSWDKFS